MKLNMDLYIIKIVKKLNLDLYIIKIVKKLKN